MLTCCWHTCSVRKEHYEKQVHDIEQQMREAKAEKRESDRERSSREIVKHMKEAFSGGWAWDGLCEWHEAVKHRSHVASSAPTLHVHSSRVMA